MAARWRAEEGFGLVELLIAMTILNIALLALVAAFSSGIAAGTRAERLGTASSLADSQMELYRGLTWCSIRLDDGSIPTSPDVYVGDTAYSGSQVLDTASCGGSVPTCSAGPPVECDASRDVPSTSSPDNRPYRVDTYIVADPAAPTTLKRVTVVVRDGANLSGLPFARQVSTFETNTGE
jgi:type II secretory pathway pseudopilin PulG